MIPFRFPFAWLLVDTMHFLFADAFLSARVLESQAGGLEMPLLAGQEAITYHNNVLASPRQR